MRGGERVGGLRFGADDGAKAISQILSHRSLGAALLRLMCKVFFCIDENTKKNSLELKLEEQLFHSCFVLA